MTTTTTHLHTGTTASNTCAAACGRHKNHGRRYTTGLRTSVVWLDVDCAACQRTAAYKARRAASPVTHRAAPVRPAEGTRVRAYGLAAVVVAPRFGTRADEVTIQWDAPGHKDHGRRCTVAIAAAEVAS